MLHSKRKWEPALGDASILPVWPIFQDSHWRELYIPNLAGALYIYFEDLKGL